MGHLENISVWHSDSITRSYYWNETITHNKNELIKRQYKIIYVLLCQIDYHINIIIIIFNCVIYIYTTNISNQKYTDVRDGVVSCRSSQILQLYNYFTKCLHEIQRDENAYERSKYKFEYFYSNAFTETLCNTVKNIHRAFSQLFLSYSRFTAKKKKK